MPTPLAARRIADSPWVIAVCGGLLVLAVAWAYASSLSGPFVFDDLTMIQENPALLHYWPASSLGSRRFVGHWSFAFNRRMNGLAPPGYHLLNAAIHAASGLILFGLVRRTLLAPANRGAFRKSATFVAFSVALLWVVHPLQTAAVTYLIQRLESLMAMFYLLFLYAVVRAAESRRPLLWSVVAVVACMLGMATKEVMMTAPFVAVVLDRVYYAPSWSELLRRRGWMYLAVVPSWAWMMVSLLQEVTSTAPASVGLSVPGISSTVYLMNQGPVILHYLRLAVWPSPLCLDYGWRPRESLSHVWPQCLVILGLLTLALVAFWKRPRLGFLGLAFFAILSPTSSIVPAADLAFEHRMYLPLAPLVILAVLLGKCGLDFIFDVRRWRGKAQGGAGPEDAASVPPSSYRTARSAVERCRMLYRIVAVGALHFVSQALLVGAISRNKTYQGFEDIWASAVAISPDNFRSHVNLAGALYLKAEFASAKEHLHRAIELLPNPQAFTYLAQIALQEDRPADARANYQAALELSPHYSRALDGLGKLALRDDDPRAAARLFQQAVDSDPYFVPGWQNLAEAHLRLQAPAQAVIALRHCLELWPENIVARRRLAWILSTYPDGSVRDGQTALLEVGQIFRLLRDPASEDFSTRSAALAELGDFPAALRDAQSAVAAATTEAERKLFQDRLLVISRNQPIRQR